MALFGRGSDDDDGRQRSAAEREEARRARQQRRAATGEFPAVVPPDPEPEELQAARVEPEPERAQEPVAEPVTEPEPPRRAEPRADDDFTWTDSTEEHRAVVAPTEDDPIEVPFDHHDEPARAEPLGAEPAVGSLRTDPPALPARRAARGGPRPTRAPRLPRRDLAPGAPRPVRRPRMRTWGGRILALLALAGVGFALWFAFNLFQPGKGDGSGKVVVVVPKGSSARDIGDLLAERGVVSSGFFFDLRSRLSGKRDKLEAGRFVLAKDMSYGAAIDKLTQPPKARPTVAFTIPEGRTREEEAPKLAKAGVGGDYLKLTKRSSLLNPRDYGAPKGTNSLEGFLFPATYDLPRGNPTASDLVRLQLRTFKREFGSVSLARAKKRNLTPYDVLTIASMVESEAQVARDRPLIAAVIYNRLKQHIPLGIDATTRYALHKQSGALTQSELAIDSPYNTRTRQGLPPTPISSPGLPSIRAAANPAKVPYLYFVVKAGGCGEHVFSSTIEKFQADAARYSAAREAKGGRSPTRKC